MPPLGAPTLLVSDDAPPAATAAPLFIVALPVLVVLALVPDPTTARQAERDRHWNRLAKLRLSPTDVPWTMGVSSMVRGTSLAAAVVAVAAVMLSGAGPGLAAVEVAMLASATSLESTIGATAPGEGRGRLLVSPELLSCPRVRKRLSNGMKNQGWMKICLYEWCGRGVGKIAMQRDRAGIRWLGVVALPLEASSALPFSCDSTLPNLQQISESSKNNQLRVGIELYTKAPVWASEQTCRVTVFSSRFLFASR
jgi:hypothetical protein